MPQICRLEVTDEHVVIADSEPRPQVARKYYDVVGLHHIPDIQVSITSRGKHESIELTLPTSVTNKLPVLAACHGDRCNSAITLKRSAPAVAQNSGSAESGDTSSRRNRRSLMAAAGMDSTKQCL